MPFDGVPAAAGAEQVLFIFVRWHQAYGADSDALFGQLARSGAFLRHSSAPVCTAPFADFVFRSVFHRPFTVGNGAYTEFSCFSHLLFSSWLGSGSVGVLCPGIQRIASGLPDPLASGKWSIGFFLPSVVDRS